MKKILQITLCFLLSILFFSPSLQIYSQDVKGELSEIEAERTKKVEEQLLLNLPEISDNPNHIITFKDPSGEGVSLETDAQGFKKITSPYTLPSLGLGKHILTFKFSDEEDTEQILERSFTIIPRPPVLNPPTIVNNEITVSGTAISNSTVDLFLTKDLSNQKALTEVSENGEWEYIFTKDIEEGVYTIVAVTRRNGLASNYSEPIVFTVDGDASTITPIEDTNQGVSFSFKDIDFSNYKNILNILKENTDLAISFGSFFLLGCIFILIFLSLTQRITQKKSKKVLQELLTKNTSNSSGSFREKFENTKGQNEEEPKTEETVEEETKSLTKNEFLEKFKDFDPDDENGKEKKLKK